MTAKKVKPIIITTTAEAFVAALKQSKPEKKTTIPVLSYVKVEDGQIIATDLDMWTVVPFEAKGAGTFLIPCRQVLDVLTGEKGKLTIEATTPPLDSKGALTPLVKFAINGCEYKFDTMRDTTFPQMPKPAEPAFTMDGKEFRKLVDRTLFAASREESRYILNGVLLKAGNDQVEMIATDGHRLSHAVASHIRATLPDTLIRSRTLDYLKSHVGEDVSIGVADDYQTFKTDGITVLSKVLQGTFPSYEAVMPKDDEERTHATIPSCAKLSPVLTRVAKCADERSGAISFVFDGGLKLLAKSTKRGSASATVPCTVGDGKATIGLNSTYILDFLKQAGDVPVEVLFKDGQTSVLFKLPDYSYLVMPMWM